MLLELCSVNVKQKNKSGEWSHCKFADMSEEDEFWKQMCGLSGYNDGLIQV